MEPASRTRRVSIGGHPGIVVVIVAIGIVGMAITLPDVRSAGELHLGLIVGIGVGLPAVLIEKWLLRRFRDSYAEFCTTPLSNRGWRLQKTSLLCASPLLCAMMAATVVARRVGASPGVSLGVLCIMCSLWYPEQKAVYRAAQALIAQTGGSDEQETPG